MGAVVLLRSFRGNTTVVQDIFVVTDEEREMVCVSSGGLQKLCVQSLSLEVNVSF